MDGRENRPKRITTTQGHNKQLLLFSDLLKNKQFMTEVRSIQVLKSLDRKQYALDLAQKYGLLYCLGSPLFQLINFNKISDRNLWVLDMCRINGDYFEHSGECEPTYAAYKIPAKHYYQTHPISIGISTKASQRDVIDFIKKNWHQIELNLSVFGERPKRVRIRPKLKRDSFIWQKYKDGFSIAEILKKLDTEFPKEVLNSDSIYTIISQERERRNEI